MSLRNALKTLLLFASASLLGAALAAPAQATPAIDRWSAVAYADMYACNAGSVCENSGFRLMDADCTNFVSQTISAAGMPMTNPGWYYTHAGWPGNVGDSRSSSWSIVSNFRSYWGTTRGAYTVYTPTSMQDKYTPASPGDLYLYDWGLDNKGYSHLSVSTGFGTFANVSVLDSNGSWLNTSQVTGGGGDFINQHTENRKHTPWNYGFWLQKDTTIKGLMRTVILHWL